MIKIGTIALSGILMLSACSPQQDATETCERISVFSRIIMDARQSEVDKEFVISKVLETSKDQSSDEIELELTIVDRAYEMPVMESAEDRELMSEDFSNIMLELCLNPEKIDTASIV